MIKTHSNSMYVNINVKSINKLMSSKKKKKKKKGCFVPYEDGSIFSEFQRIEMLCRETRTYVP